MHFIGRARGVLYRFERKHYISLNVHDHDPKSSKHSFILASKPLVSYSSIFYVEGGGLGSRIFGHLWFEFHGVSR